jgi:putative FmdB family regulatory protein
MVAPVYQYAPPDAELTLLSRAPTIEVMPLYEYECKKCGHRFEKIQKFSDPMLKKCPECGGKIEQMISAPAFQFKGSGWYVNDYAKKPAPASSGKNGSESGNSDSSAELKPDSKPKTESESRSKSDSDSKKIGKSSESESKKASKK